MFRIEKKSIVIFVGVLFIQLRYDNDTFMWQVQIVSLFHKILAKVTSQEQIVREEILEVKA